MSMICDMASSSNGADGSTGLHGRIVETLPLFLAMTNDQTAVKKLLTFVRSWLSPAIVFTETDSLSLFRRRRRFSTIKSE